MATNFRQPGNVITVAAPADTLSGAGVKVGKLFGVAMAGALSGAEVEIGITGVWSLPKDNNLVISEGDELYWDATNSWLDKTSTGSPTPQRVAIAIQGATQTSTVVLALLTPGTIT